MAIREIFGVNGERRFKVYVNLRSSSEPSIRIQKENSKAESMTEAHKLEKAMLREAERELTCREQAGSTWEQVIESFYSHEVKMMKYGRASLSLDVLDDYIAMLNSYTTSWLKRPARDISSGDVRRILETMELRGGSNSSRKKLKGIVSKVFRFGVDLKMIRGVTATPTEGIKLKNFIHRRQAVLNTDEIRNLLMRAREIEPDWYFIWSMAVYTGMRSGELYALTWNDIDLDSRVIHVTKSYNKRKRLIKSTKSGDWRDVPVSSSLLSILTELKQKQSIQDYVLPHPRDWQSGMQAQKLRQFLVGIGLRSNGIMFHTLRACFATELLKAGMAPIKVMKVAGWKDIKTMMHYIRLAGIEIEGVTDPLDFSTSKPNSRIGGDQIADPMIGLSDLSPTIS
jgi:integrase